MITSAIILAAGRGTRMQSDVPKQYMEIGGKPLIYYSLKTFEESFFDEIILVVSPGDLEYCRREIVEKYSFHKVASIVEGGAERYHSVYRGLQATREDASYVFIHDGARACITQEILNRTLEAVRTYGSGVVGMPVKDTIKLVNEGGFVESTPDRNRTWLVQTPQAFVYKDVLAAYEELIKQEETLLARGIHITDDAMVMETFSEKPVRLVEGAYTNIKVTTPEDMDTAAHFLL